jgi:hypothetical protein
MTAAMTCCRLDNSVVIAATNERASGTHGGHASHIRGSRSSTTGIATTNGSYVSLNTPRESAIAAKAGDLDVADGYTTVSGVQSVPSFEHRCIGYSPSTGNHRDVVDTARRRMVSVKTQQRPTGGTVDSRKMTVGNGHPPGPPRTTDELGDRMHDVIIDLV